MVVLIILNIILIVLLIVLVLYIFRNKNDDTKNDQNEDDVYVENKRVKYKQNKKINSEQVFVGRFITDEEYQQMMNNRRSDISILLEEVELEYEHFKELNNESKRNSER